MNYAIVENGLVTNLIWLNPQNAADFPQAIYLGDRPVAIGDSYTDGVFTRDGVEVLTPLESMQAEIAELDAALLDAAYENLIGGLEL